MSKFLAPIHYWLFNKIVLLEELEKEVEKIHIERFGDKAVEIKENALDKFGDFLEAKPLEELINHSNIHGWLQERIMIAESRIAFVITSFKEEYNDESKKILEDLYVKQGAKYAEVEENLESPELVYKALGNYILSGMPCDRVNSIIESTDDFIIYSEKKDIHKDNYLKGNGDLEFLNWLNFKLVKSFIESIKPVYKYEVEDNVTENIIKIVKG